MLGREKPFEALSEKEREAYQLAKDIVLWTRDEFVAQWPGALEILDKANKLYSLVGGMDMEHDDRYYKAHEMVSQLRGEYEVMRKRIDSVKEKKIIKWNFDIDRDSVDALVSDIRQALTHNIDMLTLSLSSQKIAGFVEFFITRAIRLRKKHEEELFYRFGMNESIVSGSVEDSVVLKAKGILERHFGLAFQQMNGVYARHIHDDNSAVDIIFFNNETGNKIEEKLRLIINEMRGESTVRSS